MAVRYKVEIFDQDGSRVALFDDWMRLSIKRNLNNPDIIQFVIDGNDDRKDLFELDGQIIVSRKNPAVGLDYYEEAGGFLRGYLLQEFENGRFQYTAYARGWEDMLQRRIIGYYAGTVNSTKDAVAETVMKEFVKENAGSLATTTNGRLRNGVISELSVEADGVSGENWSGARAYRNLLEVLVEIANATGTDFWIAKTGDKAWEFRTGSEGNDRTEIDYNRATGKNGAGYAPVVFSAWLATVEDMSYNTSRLDEINVVYALGRGERSLRTVSVRTDEGAIADSFLNTREVSRNGSAQEFEYQLEDFGDDWLLELAANPEFTFQPTQTDSQYYGKDFFLGDYVTAKMANIITHKRIVGVGLSVGQDGKESLTLTYRDIVL